VSAGSAGTESLAGGVAASLGPGVETPASDDVAPGTVIAAASDADASADGGVVFPAGTIGPPADAASSWTTGGSDSGTQGVSVGGFSAHAPRLEASHNRQQTTTIPAASAIVGPGKRRDVSALHSDG
jgi:hypothetical protein